MRIGILMALENNQFRTLKYLNSKYLNLYNII